MPVGCAIPRRGAKRQFARWLARSWDWLRPPTYDAVAIAAIKASSITIFTSICLKVLPPGLDTRRSKKRSNG